MTSNFFAVIMVIIALTIGLYINSNLKSQKEVSIKYLYQAVPDIISDEQHIKLKTVCENIDKLDSVADDFQNLVYPHFGEAIEPTTDNKCNKTYLIYSKYLNKCIFHNRVDVAKHYIMYGGFHGWKQRYADIILRLLVFQNYQFNNLNKSIYNELFNLKEFKNAVNKMCTKDKPYFKPFQLELIVNLPGTNIPSHLDIPYFIGANRYAFPQWLLLVMQDSGLFKKRRLSQVQALIYINDWNTTEYDSNEYGGQFFLYPNGVNEDVKIFDTLPKYGIFCDGCETVHGSATFKPNIKPINMDKDSSFFIKFNKTINEWVLYNNSKPTEHTYKWSEIRSAIAYRGWCFKTKKEMRTYNPHYYDPNDLTLNNIIDILKNDLIERNIISQNKLDKMDRYGLGLYFIEKYIKLPKPEKAYIKFNYCVIFDLLPAYKLLTKLSQVIC